MIPALAQALRSLVFLARARGYTNVEITAGELDGALGHAEQLATRCIGCRWMPPIAAPHLAYTSHSI